MGEQDHYRPPRWPAESGSVSLGALETAFGTVPPGPSRDDEPDHDARVRRPGPDRPVPPWPAVVATTVRLWLRRRGAALARLARPRWAIALAALAVVALVVTGLTGFPGQQARRATTGHAAAVWVAYQVSHDAIVGCDPGMCRALRAQGFPASSLLVLRPGAAGLRLCDVIVATQGVRHLLGNRLQQENAPAVIARFGSGAAR
jgi:hypothetical protein